MQVEFRVDHTNKQKSGAVEHHGVLNKGVLKVSDAVQANVDKNLVNVLLETIQQHIYYTLHFILFWVIW